MRRNSRNVFQRKKNMSPHTHPRRNCLSGFSITKKLLKRAGITAIANIVSHSMRRPFGAGRKAKILTGFLMAIMCFSVNGCSNVTPRLMDLEMIAVENDDNQMPSQPLATRHFVLNADKEQLQITEGQLHNGRTTRKLDVDAPSGISLDPTLSGEAVMVFYFGGAKFQDQYTFYLKNDAGVSDFNIEVKNNDKRVKWYFVRNLQPGIWKKVTIEITKHKVLDPDQINEILIHLKGKGTLLIDGIG